MEEKGRGLTDRSDEEILAVISHPFSVFGSFFGWWLPSPVTRHLSPDNYSPMRIPFTRHRKIPGWLFPGTRMRRDWDLRARKDALYYIDCGHGQSADTFWASGVEDVERLILRDIEVSEMSAILEIGCGIGRLLRPFVSRVRSVAGIDISGEMIERARREFADTPRAAFWRTDGDLAPI